MYWLCMIATIPLATGNKLNCFISARGMLAIVWHCVLLFFFCVCFLLIFYMLINHLLKKKSCINLQLPIVILKKKTMYLDMHHHKTYMYINFQQNWINRSVITVHTNVFRKLLQVV